MNKKYKYKKGFTLSEIIITIAVLAVFLAVSLPMFTTQKNFTGRDKDAAACVTNANFDINSAACVSALNKCERNKGNACATLLSFIDSYSDPALTIIGQSCKNGGKEACSILINRCINDPANCAVVDKDYDVAFYLNLPRDNDGLSADLIQSKNLMFNLLKKKIELGITNISNIVESSCDTSDPSLMACSLLQNKIYDFDTEDQPTFTEMSSEFGTIFKDGYAQLANNYWLIDHGGAASDLPSGNNVIAASGNYLYLTGREQSDTFGDYDIFVLKINKNDGTTVWKKHYGGAAEDYAVALAFSGGYVYVTGDTKSDTSGLGDVFVMKLNDSDGSAVWKRRYGTAGTNDNAATIAVYGSGIWVGGTTYLGPYGERDMLVMKLNTADGSTAWTRRIGTGSTDMLRTMKLNQQGSYLYIAGDVFTDMTNQSDPFIVIMDPNAATILMSRVYNSVGNEITADITFANNLPYNSDMNYLYITGMVDSMHTFLLAIKSDVATAGGVLYRKVYMANFINSYSIIPTTDNNYLYILGSQSFSATGAGDNDLIIMKLNRTNGSIMGINSLSGISGERLKYATILGDYIYFTGEYLDIFATYDIFLMKYNLNNNYSNIPFSLITVNSTIPTNAMYSPAANTTAWAANSIRTPTTAVDSPWTTAAAQTTGGTGDDLNASWTKDGSAGTSLNFYYYISTNSDIHGNNLKKIVSVDITQTTAAGTDIKYLVSFDKKNTWKKWDGTSWETVDISKGIEDKSVATIGNTAAEIEDHLSNYNLPLNSKSVDFLIYLSTNSHLLTPYLDNISVWYY